MADPRLLPIMKAGFATLQKRDPALPCTYLWDKAITGSFFKCSAKHVIENVWKLQMVTSARQELSHPSVESITLWFNFLYLTLNLVKNPLVSLRDYTHQRQDNLLQKISEQF